MRILTVLLAVLILFTSCGTAVLETAEEVRTFDDLLSFITGNPEKTVTGIILNVESAISESKPLTLSESDASRLLSLLTETVLTAERFEPEHIYGGSWYTVTFTLSDGASVTLYSDQNELTVSHRELNEEQRWYDAPYRLNTASSHEFYTTVSEIWSSASDEEPATH